MKNCKENMIAPMHQFRNKLNALLGDDPAFTVYEVDEPLPDGTIDVREDGHTLNIVCNDVDKIIIAREHIGTTHEVGSLLYIDYYFSRNNNVFVNANEQPALNSLNSSLDIKMLFEGNPHFSNMYSGWGQMGPWHCVAFKPELIQYRNDDAGSLHGRRSCAMEDIANEIFHKDKEQRIFFSTENVEDLTTHSPLLFNTSTTGVSLKLN